jgi:hypothetical protein
MTVNDMILLKTARVTNFREYKKVHMMIDQADSEDTRQTLRNIRDILYEMYIDRV